MANYEGKARTNYIKVKDETAFREAVENISEVELIEEDDMFGFLFDEGIVPLSVLKPDLENNVEDEYDEVELVDFLAPFMEDGEICVVVGIGNEKMRYFDGFAYAFNNEKKMISISLDDIYEKAESEFGVRPTDAAY